jgi:DnaJ-domain-containing protein 1
MSATCAIRSLASTTLRNQRCVSGRYGGGHSAIQAICTSGSRARVVGGRALSRTVPNNRDAACVALEPVLPWSNLGRSGSPSVRGAWHSVSRRCLSRGRGGGAGGGTKTHFEVLGVVSDATATEVKAAYLELAKIHHPDATIGLSDVNSTRADERDERDGATGSTADASFKEIVQAYETLKDPARRELYVQSLPRASHGGPVTERTRRETAGEATLRELIEAGNVDAALKHWEAGGSTLQSLLHIIKVGLLGRRASISIRPPTYIAHSTQITRH